MGTPNPANAYKYNSIMDAILPVIKYADISSANATMDVTLGDGIFSCFFKGNLHGDGTNDDDLDCRCVIRFVISSSLFGFLFFFLLDNLKEKC